MKTNKQITEALKSLADAINNYAESIPQPDFEKGGVEFLTRDKNRKDSYYDFAEAGGDKGIECIVDSKGKIHPLPTMKPRKENPMVDEEPELEVGKWYFKLDTKSILNYQGTKDGVITAYGLMWGKEWSDVGNFGRDVKEWTPATDKEVEEALIQEARRRGFKEGVKFKSPKYGYEYRCDSDNFYYSRHGLFSSHATGGYLIFSKETSKWAEIIEQPEKKPDYFGEYVKTIIHDRKLSDLSTLEMWELQDKILKELKNRI